MFTEYQNRIVAFIDILGFSQLIKKSLNNQEVFKQISRVLAFIHRTKKETDENSNLVCDKRITIFSDSIIISVLDVENSLLELILDIRYLQQNSVMHGLLLRGGISIGKLIHTEKDIYGPVFIDAYKLESECAIYPRIILHPNILKNIQNKTDDKEYLNTILSYVEKDNNDDFFYLKYLDCVEDFDEEQKEFDYFKLINKQKELIEEGYCL